MMKIQVKPVETTANQTLLANKGAGGDVDIVETAELRARKCGLHKPQLSKSQKVDSSPVVQMRQRVPLNAVPVKTAVRTGPRGAVLTKHDSWVANPELTSITPTFVRSASMKSLTNIECTSASNPPPSNSTSITKVCWYEQQQKKQLWREHKQQETDQLEKQQDQELQQSCQEVGGDDITNKAELDTIYVPQEADTITRGLLATSGFVWVPCKAGTSGREVTEDTLKQVEAMRCRRYNKRRNALADPMKMAMPQETRERIQHEVARRKNSFTRKFSQYFKAIYSDDYEVDLV